MTLPSAKTISVSFPFRIASGDPVEEWIETPSKIRTTFAPSSGSTKQVDAYVVDESLLLSAMQGSEAFKIVGEFFTQNPYGIGLPQGSDAKALVNAFLKEIYDNDKIGRAHV